MSDSESKKPEFPSIAVQESASGGCCATPEPENTGCCSAPVETTSCCDGSNSSSWWQSRLGFLWSAWGLVLLIPFIVFIADAARFKEFLTIASSALAGTAPYIVFAVLLIAYLKATGAESLVATAFEGRENRMIVFAAFFGGLAPFCSCEVIPFVAGLLALGAPLSAVMAFWLSSPLIDPPSLMITAGALGWEFAIGKAVAAVFVGLLGGYGVKLVVRSGTFNSPLKKATASGCSTGACDVNTDFSQKPVWQFWKQAERIETFKSEGTTNAIFLFKWLAFAYILEALLILYVPASLIGSIVGGDGFGSIVIGALVGMPAYLNSYAAPPLVAGLMEQGMSAGSAMAFMVAGAISSIPAMTAVWSLVKKQIFVAYLVFGVGGAILFGAVFALLITNSV